MTTPVHEKFEQWTHGLDTHDSMISVFEHIRDIPYVPVTDPGMHDPARAPELILLTGRGSCAPKHYLLAAMYKKLDLGVVFATFPFTWNDSDIRYPPPLRGLAARLPVAYHLACRVQIGCRWVLVDATWDPPLAKAGFPVNMDWDGYSDTECAVKPLRSPLRTAFCRTLTSGPFREPGEQELCPADGEKDHWEAGDRERYYRQRISLRTTDERELTLRFYRELGEWMERVREPGYRSGLI